MRLTNFLGREKDQSSCFKIECLSIWKIFRCF